MYNKSNPLDISEVAKIVGKDMALLKKLVIEVVNHEHKKVIPELARAEKAALPSDFVDKEIERNCHISQRSIEAIFFYSRNYLGIEKIVLVEDGQVYSIYYANANSDVHTSIEKITL